MRRGFLLPAVLTACCLGLWSCRDNGSEPVIEPELPDPPPVLQNLVVDLAPFDSASGRAGAVMFDPSKDKVFYEFNAEVAIPGGVKTLPTFEFHVAPDAPLYMPADGYIAHFVYQPATDDYEIGISRRPNPTSPLTGMITVDHIREITVRQGDAVKAGQLLGKPGPLYEGVGRTELMIYGNDSAYCPFDYMPDSLAEGYRVKIRRLMADWEAYKKDTTLYREALMPEPGCLGHSGKP